MRRCINLRNLATPVYQVHYFDDQRTDPWQAYVPCKGQSHIYPHGKDTLAIFLASPRGILDNLLAAGCKLKTQGTDGATLTFPGGLFKRVAEIAWARRKRRLTAEQKAACVKRLAKYAYPTAAQPSKAPLVSPVEGGAVCSDVGATA